MYYTKSVYQKWSNKFVFDGIYRITTSLTDPLKFKRFIYFEHEKIIYDSKVKQIIKIPFIFKNARVFYNGLTDEYYLISNSYMEKYKIHKLPELKNIVAITPRAQNLKVNYNLVLYKFAALQLAESIQLKILTPVLDKLVALKVNIPIYPSSMYFLYLRNQFVLHLHFDAVRNFNSQLIDVVANKSLIPINESNYATIYKDILLVFSTSFSYSDPRTFYLFVNPFNFTPYLQTRYYSYDYNSDKHLFTEVIFDALI